MNGEATASGEAAGPDVVVIGAGIAGLSSAVELVRAGLRVLVIDKSRGVGGRMATRRIGGAVCDHGAQFFTVRSPGFQRVVTEASAAGAVAVWYRGFASANEAAEAGHPRWRGARGMTDLPKRLAALAADQAGPGRLELRLGVRAARVGPLDSGRVEVGLEAGGAGPATTIPCRGAILTPPVPQALDLLAAGGTALDTAAGRLLRTVEYDPCLALLVTLARASLVPPPGGMPLPAADSEPLAWVADNMQKGISPVPALTAHATGRFSRRHFDTVAEEVTRVLIERLRPWIDGDPGTVVGETSLHRWRFALPTTVLAEPLVVASECPPLVCCGDAFAGPRVEGAAESGAAAGRWLARLLDTSAGETS